ncbi:hypothetical protein BpHYR1_018368 [Brachionus plicatilis]|uniref:Uncharacterized protein n=1 Tax=Brachionus plicatilis TaxID=10195 RepID=A0A3M7PB97_BRAPC|nr:hypothetical protein BpHYR1_018368 [Brachionus plicatilis]
MSSFKSSINDSGNGTINQNDELNETEPGRKLPGTEQPQHGDTSSEEEFLNDANLSHNAACKLAFFD